MKHAISSKGNNDSFFCIMVDMYILSLKSRLLSDYLGLETMLAIVCKTYDSIKSLEAYDKEGHVNKTLGLHGLGASIQRPLDGHFLVICLEKLRFEVKVMFLEKTDVSLLYTFDPFPPFASF